jgi:transglycosylase-like protein with SLT domain
VSPIPTSRPRQTFVGDPEIDGSIVVVTDAVRREIPLELLEVYVRASATCSGLQWQLLAAIGAAESSHGGGRLDEKTGDVLPPVLGPAIDGRPGVAEIADPSSPDGWAHARGLMQFIPSTWEKWQRVAPNRPADAKPSVDNAWDAIYAAADYLCAGKGALGEVDAALFSYNRSTEYVDVVKQRAVDYGWDSTAPATIGPPAS